MEPFDLEAVYDDEIFPLMAAIIAVCKRHKMPMFATFQYVEDEEIGAAHCSTFLVDSPGGGTCHKMRELGRAVDAPGSGASPTLKLTTRGKDGSVTEETVIIP